MAETVTIRPGTASDAALLAELGERTFIESYAEAIGEPVVAFAKKRYGEAQQAAELADPRVTFFIASVGAQPAGYAMLRVGAPPLPYAAERPVELSRLYLEKRWTGRGVGAALMDGCLDEARRRGHDVLWLSVWEHNTGARRFYERYGFELIGSHPFHLVGNVQTDFAIALRL